MRAISLQIVKGANMGAVFNPYDPKWIKESQQFLEPKGVIPAVYEKTPYGDRGKDINLYINSPGGSIYAGLAIYDTMQWIKPDVSTICVGMAMSMGAVLLTAGTKGKRFCLPNSTVLIHQPLGGAEGQAADIEITAREILRLRRGIYDILVRHTGQPLERIMKDSDRNYYLTAPEAVEYGLIDDVLSHEAESALTH